MLLSMTGYGKSEFIGDNRKYIIEIKSVNHKYLDISFRLPKSLFEFEENVRKRISEKISRGKIDVFVRFENFSELGKNIKFDDELLRQYMNEFERVSKKFNIENDIKLSNLILVDNIIKNEQDVESKKILQEEFMKGLDDAINNYILMKQNEGIKLQKNIEEKLEILYNNICDIEKLSFNVVEDYRIKIEKRLKEYIEENKIDNNRILTEIVIFADKMTIDEEIIRFKSHINQFKNELKSGKSSGKKLDFIIQELNRETNTIGSKTNCLEITNLVIINKAIIENIREQIQNIE